MSLVARAAQETGIGAGNGSHSLNKAKQKYDKSHLECLPVVGAGVFENWCLQRKICTVKMDGNAIPRILNLIYLTGRLARWPKCVSELDFKVFNRAGGQHEATDE